jgi:hypothetical protein
LQDRAEKLSICSGPPDHGVSILQCSPGTHYAKGTVNCGGRRANLGRSHDTVEWILTQLTAARWYLDQAVGDEPGAVRRNVDSARRTYDHVLTVLPTVDLTIEIHRQVQQELAELQYRLRAIEKE